MKYSKLLVVGIVVLAAASMITGHDQQAEAQSVSSSQLGFTVLDESGKVNTDYGTLSSGYYLRIWSARGCGGEDFVTANTQIIDLTAGSCTTGIPQYDGPYLNFGPMPAGDVYACRNDQEKPYSIKSPPHSIDRIKTDCPKLYTGSDASPYTPGNDQVFNPFGVHIYIVPDGELEYNEDRPWDPYSTCQTEHVDSYLQITPYPPEGNTNVNMKFYIDDDQFIPGVTVMTFWIRKSSVVPGVLPYWSGSRNVLSPGPSGFSEVEIDVPLEPGDYFVSWMMSKVIDTHTGQQLHNNCHATLTVKKPDPPVDPPAASRQPYFRVYGGDVSVGAGFRNAAGACGVSANAGIIAFNNGTGGGSATQLAAFAMNQIFQFTSATTRTSAPQPPKGLSFSNTAGHATYGGAFGAHNMCALDYFNRPVANGFTETNPGASLSNISIPNGTRRVYRTTGDLVIGGSGVQFASTTWSSLAAIPSVYVITTGNIYIQPSVTQLDGVYIAGGTIYTCANGSTPFTAAGLAAAAGCRNKLTINGAFIANQVKLLRTGGDIGSSSAGEGPTSNSMAESFIYTAENFLNSPFKRAEPYDSISNLPPVL